MKYDVLKLTGKKTLSLTSSWLQENLDIGENDLILQATKEHNGQKYVILTKFSPEQQFGTEMENAFFGQKEHKAPKADDAENPLKPISIHDPGHTE